MALRPLGIRGEVRRAGDRQIVVDVTSPDDVEPRRRRSASRRRARGSSRASKNLGCSSSLRRRRLLSTSDCTVSGVAPQTASAASYVHPPAKTERPRKRLCSASSSRSCDHSIVARSVCWRGSASRPAVSRSSRSDNRSRSWLRREDDRSGRRQLESERQVVQPGAELRDRRRLAHACVEAASASHEELDAVLVCQRRNGVQLLALELEPLSARDEDRRTGDVAERRDLSSDVRQEVLRVVEQEQRALPVESRGERARQSRCQAPPRLRAPARAT